MSLISIVRLVAWVLVVFSAACSDPFPPGVSQLHSCIRGAGLSATEVEQSTECAIPTDWELVGIPSGNVQASLLVAIGVDPELAEMLVAGEEQDARWCVARRVTHDPSKGSEQTTAEASCTDSDLAITDAVHSRGDSVSLVFRRGSDGKPILIDVKGL